MPNKIRADLEAIKERTKNAAREIIAGEPGVLYVRLDTALAELDAAYAHGSSRVEAMSDELQYLEERVSELLACG